MRLLIGICPHKSSTTALCGNPTAGTPNVSNISMRQELLLDHGYAGVVFERADEALSADLAAEVSADTLAHVLGGLRLRDGPFRR